jgi:hypothetical protein
MQPDILRFARTCSSIPSGSGPSGLTPSKSGDGLDTDPRLSTKRQFVGVAFADPKAISDLSRAAPFSVTAILARAGRTDGSGISAIDGLGSLQFWAYWDGHRLHKAERTASSGAWTALVDDAADNLTMVVLSGGVAFFSDHATSGDHYGFVLAGPAGCSTFGMTGGQATIPVR